MNSKTLLNKAMIKSPFDKELSGKIFGYVFAEVRRLLKEKKSVTIDELGKFEIAHRKMQSRKDESGLVELLLPPKDKVVFRPSERLINRLKNDD